MRHVLALDQSPRRLGWALGSHKMLKPLTGVYMLPSAGREHGVICGAVRDWLDGTIKTYHVQKVCFETPFIAGNGPRATWAVMNKLVGVIELVCHDHEIPCFETTPDNWRRHFMGVCRAPRELSPARRRTWLKQQALEACAFRRWKVTSDDEADACGILSYLLELDAERKKAEAA